MGRRKKMMLNSASSLLYQFTAIIAGFILPRFFLTHYGSELNGLVSSITQFLGLITLAECGVGAVVQSALYKPLAENDILEISRIVASSKRFFRNIAYILLGYVACMMVFYPLVTLESYDYLFTLALIFVISISTFAQYYLGMADKLILNADQVGFYQYFIHTAVLIVNTVFCILLMQNGATIHVVKLSTSLIFTIQPLLLFVIARKRYKLDHKVTLTEEPIAQKWNGMAHHVAGVVLVNTDTVILTLLSTLENVSIYAVYHLVVNGLKQIVLAMTNGMRAMLGNMLAKNETEELSQAFERIEWLLHTLVTLIFSVAAVMIVPFVRIYTANVADANYIVPGFAFLITLAQASYCYRLPYYILVNAAGHYKQTQKSAIIEATINVVLSVVLVFFFGLIGVAIGTLVAMVYRTVYLANYLRKNILFRKLHHFVKHIIVDACSAALLFVVVSMFPSFFAMEQANYLAWIALGVKVSTAEIVLLAITNCLFYGKGLNIVLRRIKR